MPRFDQHFRMTEKDIAEYVEYRVPGFSEGRDLAITEIGDGNINFVFRVQDALSGRSIIIKHADISTRSGSTRLGFDRIRIEADALKMQGLHSPHLVPKVLEFDPVMSCIIMEDISDHRNLRLELMNRRRFPLLAADITDFIVMISIRTFDMIISSSDKKALVQHYTNPSLCGISEALVFTEPYGSDPERIILYPSNAEFMKKELFDDKELQLEAAKLKYSFMNNAQALIHGDLHTGSIFVLPESTKIIDPEFAFFGPVGYDLGTLIANLCIAWVNAYVLYNDGERKEEFMVWLEGCISEVVDRFIEKFFVAFTTMCMDPMGKVPGYAQWLIESIIHDAAGMAGLEIIRRVVGIAPVPDIISIVDMPKRTLAERILVHAAKNLMINRALLGRGGQFVNTTQSAAHALSECLNP